MPIMSNLLLNLLSQADTAALKPFLKPAHLKHKQILFDAGEKINAVYFPTGGVISLVVVLGSGATVEAAMVGRDGVVGAAAALDSGISLSQAIVQLEGESLKCDVGALRGAAWQSQTMLSALMRHEQALFAQAQQSAACMARTRR